MKLHSFVSAIQAFTVTRERSEVVTFSQPFMSMYHSLFIKNPDGGINLKPYTNPLSKDAWIAVAMFAVFGSLSLFLITQ